jgi:hypothetical protein
MLVPRDVALAVSPITNPTRAELQVCVCVCVCVCVRVGWPVRGNPEVGWPVRGNPWKPQAQGYYSRSAYGRSPAEMIYPRVFSTSETIAGGCFSTGMSRNPGCPNGGTNELNE